ncbi:50S ribosomal protein L34e [Candidatus Woesearchaeota archaeon]|nr:50S ribosomal protein L34e [Candidatus Woesearchaeota archaeon]
MPVSMVYKISRSSRRVRRNTPAGRAVIHYEPRKKSKATCAKCMSKLHGVTHGRGLAASKRSPSRPFGGVLCSKCSRASIKEMVRANA